MNDMVLRIADFEEQYLTADFKRWKLKTPSWFRCPTDSVEVIDMINGHKSGLAHLGAFERLQAWAVRNWKTAGFFTINKRAMNLKEIPIHCGLALFPETTSEAINRAEQLGWLEWVSLSEFRLVLETFEKRFFAAEHNKTLHNKTQNITYSADTGFGNIQVSDIEEWKSTHLQLDVDHELRKMLTWLRANPKRYKQWRRFITGWLNRATPNGPAPITESGWAKELTTQ